MPILSPHPPTLLPSSPNEKTHTPDQPPKSEESTANSPNISSVDAKNEQQTNVSSVPVLKRPILSTKEYESTLGEEEQTLEMLYDYSTLEAW